MKADCSELLEHLPGVNPNISIGVKKMLKGGYASDDAVKNLNIQIASGDNDHPIGSTQTIFMTAGNGTPLAFTGYKDKNLVVANRVLSRQALEKSLVQPGINVEFINTSIDEVLEKKRRRRRRRSCAGAQEAAQTAGAQEALEKKRRARSKSRAKKSKSRSGSKTRSSSKKTRRSKSRRMSSLRKVEGGDPIDKSVSKIEPDALKQILKMLTNQSLG